MLVNTVNLEDDQVQVGSKDNKPGGWEKEQQKWKYITKECSCVLSKQKKY